MGAASTLDNYPTLNTPAQTPDAITNQPAVVAPYSFPGGVSSTISIGTHYVLSIYPGKFQPLDCVHNSIFTYVMPPAQKDKIIHRRCNPVRLSIASTGRHTLQDTAMLAMYGTGPFQDFDYPVPPGTNGYSLLQVFDTFHQQMDWERREYVPQLFPANAVAEALVSDWTRGLMAMNFGFSPGIAAVAPSTLSNPKLLTELIQGLRQSQEGMMMAWVREADEYAGQREFKQIQERHHLAAAWLGIEDKEVHPWMRPINERAKKNCPACGEQIDGLAKRCKHCSQDLVVWYTQYPTMVDDDPVVRDFIAKMQRPATPVVQPPPLSSPATTQTAKK